MFKFSTKSLANLETCHVDLQKICNAAILRIDFSVLEGHRNKELQDKAFSEGKSKTPWPKSKHNSMPSMAVDVAPCPIDWNDRERFYFLAGILIGISQQLLKEGEIFHKLRFGGDWDSDNQFKDETFSDIPHLELSPV